MKRLFYIFHDKLGENLFATPCLNILSKKYEIIAIMKEWMIPFFEDYSFISKIIPYERLDDFKDILSEKPSLFAHHNDKQKNIFHGKYDNISPYLVKSDKEIGFFGALNNSEMFISRTRQYMMKLGLSDFNGLDGLIYKIPIPRNHTHKKSNKIIIYQGSRDASRRLSMENIRKFIGYFPTAIYLIDKTSEELCKDNHVEYILIDPITKEKLEEIYDLFGSTPRCMIGPDSALTQLSLAYDIPQIWLKTRIKIEQVIDPQYLKLCTVYSRNGLDCDQKCIGCADYIRLKSGKFKIKSEMMRHERLHCINHREFSCLNYDEADIKNIKMISDTLL